MTAEEKRFVLIKPGEYLVFTGVDRDGAIADLPEVVDKLRDFLGVAGVIVFPGDVAMDGWTTEQVAALRAQVPLPD